MANKDWIDLISAEFGVSRSVAKEMLHAMFVVLDRYHKLMITNKAGDVT